MNPVRRRKTVAVIGDARLPKNDLRLEFSYRVGRLLVDHGFVVVTGGMGGVMDAALRGGRESENWRHGSCIALLPGTDPEGSGVSQSADIIIPTGLDHGRNLIVAQSDAVIAIGGGAGTLSEIALAWVFRRLVIALRCAGWSGRLADFPIDSRQRYKDLPEDRVYGVDTAEEAVSLVRELHPQYTRRHRGISE